MDGPSGASRVGSASPTPFAEKDATVAGRAADTPVVAGKMSAAAAGSLTPSRLPQPSSTGELGGIAEVSPMNPFDSPRNDGDKLGKGEDGDVSPMNPFDSPLPGADNNNNKNEMLSSPVPTTPVNPFEGATSTGRRNSGNHTLVDNNEGTGGVGELSESKRCLDDLFQNEPAPEYAPDIDGNAREAATTIGESSKETDAACEDENDENRATASTRESSLWDENAPYADDDSHHSEDEQSIWDSSCGFCCLRLLRRMCRPRIHAPCISNPRIPLPKCLERISPRTRNIVCRTLIIVFMIVTITFTLLDLLILHKYLHVWLDGALTWLSDHPVAGGMAFVGVFLGASLCFFPVSLLMLGAGYVYIDLYGLGLGIVVAFFVCYFGCLLGAAVCFARSRYLMRQLIVRFSVKYPIVRAVDRAFESMGLRLFFLLRLSSMPFNALNYIGGITSISFRDYWWSTCAGVIPSMLWTIFVGATFGSINKRGVDGYDGHDSNPVRKGVVLGLGIGLGVMGLIGTGIYARKELTKIILAEQRERALEEQAGMETSQRLIGGESGDDDASSVGGIHMENPQLGECWDVESGPSGASPHPHDGRQTPDILDVSSSTLQSDSRSPSGRIKPRWTPETVAAELPVLPKMVRRCLSPIISLDHNGAGPTETPVDDSVRSNQSLSSSTPRLGGSSQRNKSMPPMQNISFDASENAEGYSSVENSSPTSPTRRHTLHGAHDNIQLALMASRPAAEDVSRPRANTAAVDDSLTNLPDIDETKVLSDDDASEEGDLSHIKMTPVAEKNTSNRRRCNTDPTDNVDHGAAALSAVMAKLPSTGSEGKGKPTPQRKRRQQLPLWSPAKNGIRKRHSLGSFAAWQTQEGQPSSSSSPTPSQRRSSGRAASPSHPIHEDAVSQQGGRSRSGSLPYQLSPSGNHMELDLGDAGYDDSDEEAPSREWFWIWA